MGLSEPSEQDHTIGIAVSPSLNATSSEETVTAIDRDTDTIPTILFEHGRIPVIRDTAMAAGYGKSRLLEPSPPVTSVGPRMVAMDETPG